jgi:hypothetical protein
MNIELSPIPAIFVITTIESVDEITGHPNDDSRVILQHMGTENYEDKNLKAVFYRNGALVNCNIETMNGHDFISTSHFGVQWMGGTGCSGSTWAPAEMIALDFTDGTFFPADTVQVDIADTASGQTSRAIHIISHEDIQPIKVRGIKKGDQSKRLKTPFLILSILHSGQRQISGRSSNPTPEGIPPLGSPFAGS